jgi:hypothetical protein
LFVQAVDAHQQLAESRAEWEVALQVLRQDKAAATAQLRKAMVSLRCCVLLVQNADRSWFDTGQH